MSAFSRLLPFGLGCLGLLGALFSSPGCASPSKPRDAAALYARRCSLCHAVRSPSSYPSEVWSENVKRYGARAGLTQVQRSIVLEYLRANASDAPARSAAAGGGGS